MNKVLILLSTYNGENYLTEQLESLIAQTGIDITILIRDDGSTDNTCELLKEYAEKYPNKIIVDFAKNIGCTGSFFTLMKMAVEEYSKYDYYAFSDQDDVWMPDKLNAACKALDSNKNPIRLYYCNPQLVDSQLKKLNILLPHEARGTLQESIILQPCIGCSMVFSKDLLRKASIIDPKKVDIHDAWTYKVCLSLGGSIIFDPTPHILYRQHSSNVIGGSQGFKLKWERRLKKFFSSYRFRSGQAKLLLDTYGDEIPAKEKSILTTISNYHDSYSEKIKIILNKDYSCQYLIHNIMFRIAILFGKI